MIVDEVNKNMGGTFASRFSRLLAREDAAEKINNMFGLNVSVSFREWGADELTVPGTMPEGGENNV